LWPRPTTGTTRIGIDAMKAGKDVYCEKPMVQRVEFGMPVVEAQKATGRIFQVGSQRVSSIIYQKAKDLYSAGAIGKLNMVEAWWDRNSAIGAWQYSIPPDASPETSIGTASWGARPSVRSSRCACSAGATIAITAPAWRAICSCT
jgi:predicted dehydrogenase